LDTGETLVKTKDLFTGCSVTIMPHDDVWLVALYADDRTLVSMKTYGKLPDALEAVHEWMLMLSDETEIHPSIEAAVNRMRGLAYPGGAVRIRAVLIAVRLLMTPTAPPPTDPRRRRSLPLLTPRGLRIAPSSSVSETDSVDKSATQDVDETSRHVRNATKRWIHPSN
jgi:hypothetical protein